jgi:hypothetical protein
LLPPLHGLASTVPSGTVLSVRTLEPVSSVDKAGKKFAAQLDTNLIVKGRVTAPAGSVVYGRVESSRSAGQSKLELSLTQIVANGRPVAIATESYEESGHRIGRAFVSVCLVTCTRILTSGFATSVSPWPQWLEGVQTRNGNGAFSGSSNSFWVHIPWLRSSGHPADMSDHGVAQRRPVRPGITNLVSHGFGRCAAVRRWITMALPWFMVAKLRVCLRLLILNVVRRNTAI